MRILLHSLLMQSRLCWDIRSGVNSTSRIDFRWLLFYCYRCGRLIALFLFMQEVCRYLLGFFELLFGMLAAEVQKVHVLVVVVNVLNVRTCKLPL